MNEPPLRRNLERKERYPDLAAAEQALQQLGTRLEGVQLQTDTYFRVASGRLKLREIAGQQAVLIWYNRPHEQGERLSQYYLVPVSDPQTLRAALTAALGVRGEVRKKRTIYHYCNVRIHLDEVVDLGSFVEFEAVLSATDGEAVSRERLAELGRVLQLESTQNLAGSYADIMGI
jgi:predicted adenylyl cyclase CyaB